MARTLVARGEEVAALDAALAGAAAGSGSLTLVEGPAGIGKSALLDHVRERAAAQDALVLEARASELDRGFGFGVVLQLFDPLLAAAGPERRAALLSGAAAHAALVLAPERGDRADEAGYAVLHGLYWLVANLAEERPLALLVDDLHWADVPSLRFLEYLARRLDGLRATVAGALRPHEPGAPAELLRVLAGGPAARVLRPAPLGSDAAGELLADALGSAPDAAFRDAALEATGGNPLLLSVLAREADALGLAGTAADSARAAELGAAGVAPAIERRLLALGPDAVAVARAAAVVGERGSTADVGALAGLDADACRAALDRLALARVVREGFVFVHPLVKAAVLEATPPVDRMRLHRLAATRLRERGARPAETALHWLAAEPAADAQAVADLRAAAAAATAEGAPETAVDLLARALAEPPARELRPRVLLELGELEARMQRPTAAGRLREALDGGLVGDDAARARASLGNYLVNNDPAAALDEVARGLDEARDPALRLRLEAFAIEALIFVDAFAPEREARFAAGRDDPDASPVMLAHLAVDDACAGRPRAAVLERAARAHAGGALLEQIGPASSTWNLTTHAFRFAEAPEPCAEVLRDGERLVRERGLPVNPFIEHAWAYWHRDFGSVATGAARARLGLEAVREMGVELTTTAIAAIVAENLVHLDRLDEAAAEIDVDMGAARDTYIEPFALTTRGYVRFLQRRFDEAEADLRRVVALCDARGWRSPHAALQRLRLAELLAAKGERAEALALMDHDVRVARAAGLDGALGSALLVRALALEGDDAIDGLREAVAVLEPTPYRLELGWALHDLGARLRVRGARRDAREPLRRALDLAARTESTRLARHAREELEATGAQPRRELLSGVEALTPAERRVAELAAEGLTNRQIAESLWVTHKTVEMHLGRSYGKLGIRSRRQLAGVLQPAAA
ncbi:ATP-binding protein [Conexibacter arvalis]|uniref:DNA-binding CsgD family transcriptional regulator n=1 Tax=Conexibacter arvalis TaxID=912552 RepID=A0A840IHT4_9ACTN|nr:helix-turn-helix transcriptional regulator [Conexibacter arvalis]MBB4663781.1 DNA-binding CsgD family transcriptional regulator [Conexibacter arvalis]